MSVVVFSNPTGRLILPNGQIFPAANFVDSKSLGPWPPGQFKFLTWDKAGCNADTADGPYGCEGIILFDVPQRTGMGIHSGRKTKPDALGRCGPFHCTLGCIRTTDPAMERLAEIHQTDPLVWLRVG